MKLTKLQRYTAYVIALDEIENDAGYCGLCSVFRVIFDILIDNDHRFGNMKSMFPELWRNRAAGKEDDDAFLWSSDKQRIAALKQCIKETEPK